MSRTNITGHQLDPRYFDYAASAPAWPEAIDVFIEVSHASYANPSSIHGHGKLAKRRLLELKKRLYDLVNFKDGRFLLCSSGTEANNLLIEGHLRKHPMGKLLVAEDAHDSIWYATKSYRSRATVLPIGRDGSYATKELRRRMADISLVCLNHVSNETGIVHDIRGLAQLCHRSNTRLLIDGMQAIGHLELDMDAIPCTYYSISGHKFGAVRGTGGAFIRDSDFEPWTRGGKQEWNLRAGTENLAGLASMVEALDISSKRLSEETTYLARLKQRLINQLLEIPGVALNSPENSLPGIVSVSCSGHSARALVGALSLSGFAISTGSACHDNQVEPSRVILAMGRSRKEAEGTIRISMGYGTTLEAIDELSQTIKEIVRT